VTGPAPVVAACRHAVRTALEGRTSPILVACSGGADSVALAAAAAFVAPRLNLAAGAVIVDHGMQDGSAEVARVAAGQCRDLGLDPVIIRSVTVSGPGGPEAAAREARYAALEAVADETGASTVLLGHTLDDQAETVLLALARGAGLRAIAGMPASRGRYLRPLLGLRRADTEAACTALGLTWWHDPTNVPGPDAPTRSRLRGVLPVLTEALGPGIVAGLARTASQAQEDAELLDDLADELFTRALIPEPGESSDAGTLARGKSSPEPDDGVAPDLSPEPDDGVAPNLSPEPDDGVAPDLSPDTPILSLDTTTLREAPPALRSRVIRLALLAAGASGGSLTATQIGAVRQLVDNPRGRGPVHVTGDLRARVVCGRLVIWPAPAGERSR
jgi:tRNA(Ile)-lysidine synthase